MSQGRQMLCTTVFYHADGDDHEDVHEEPLNGEASVLTATQGAAESESLEQPVPWDDAAQDGGEAAPDDVGEVDEFVIDDVSSKTPLMSLQGYWEEITDGITILVDGDEVDFHDGKGRLQLSETSESLVLEKATLIGGLPDLAVWRGADGETMVWIRAPHIAKDPEFESHFNRFKTCRLLLRGQLSKAIEEENWKRVSAMEAAWDSTWGMTKDLSLKTEMRLASGRFLVPGVCVKHKHLHFRAVVLGCEAFVRAPVAKMLTERERSVSGRRASYRSKAVYCCLMDERDTPSGGVTWIVESDIVPCTDFYPLKNRFADSLLTAKDNIKGYLPGAMLQAALKRQSLGMPLY